ncbi:MAG: N-acetyltransferase [Calditrichaeota bacterium]|nr:MAG: N-acetyltransferase [Calditrichota bacterium]
MTEIETARLALSHLSFDDAPFILTLLNDEDFIKNIGDKNVRAIADAENYLKNGPIQSYENFGFGLYRVSNKATGTPVGICGLLKRETLPDVDIGYAFLPQYCGMGYATESTCAVMAYAQNTLGLARIVAVVSPENEASKKVLHKLGLRYEKMIQLAPGDSECMLFVPETSAAGTDELN